MGVEAFVVFPKYCQEYKGVICLKPQRIVEVVYNVLARS